MEEFIFECKGLVKNYGKYRALNEIDLTIKKGKIVGLLGKNGSGKTTLIKLSVGLLTPTNGKILIEGKEIGIETKKIISYLSDETYLKDYMKVGECIKLFKDFYNDFNENKAYEMLSSLEIDPNRKIKTLSKGDKEKVNLILSMSRDAKIYFLDEPIGGVDPSTREYILNVIKRFHNKESTIIISTHLIYDVENILDEVIFIHDGNVKLHKSVEEIKEEKGKTIDEVFREMFLCLEK